MAPGVIPLLVDARAFAGRGLGGGGGGPAVPGTTVGDGPELTTLGKTWRPPTITPGWFGFTDTGCGPEGEDDEDDRVGEAVTCRPDDRAAESGGGGIGRRGTGFCR